MSEWNAHAPGGALDMFPQANRVYKNVYALDANLLDEWKSLDHTYINDFDEAAQDAVGGILTDTTTIDFAYADGTPSITADVKKTLDSSYITDFTEAAQDAVGGALVDGATVDFTYNDGANTITAEVRKTLDNTYITDFTEAAQDAIGAMVADTATIDVTYTDATPELKWDLKYITREIPIYLTAQTLASGVPTMPDEVATNIFTAWVRVPTTWDGVTDITLKTIWFCTQTGLKDIETEISYAIENDEAAFTTVSAFTNTNLSWTTANTTKVLTTTITPSGGRFYRVRFRCNTGDASTGDLFHEGAYATTKVQ